MKPPPLRYDLSGAIVHGLFFEVLIPFDEEGAEKYAREFRFTHLTGPANYNRVSYVVPEIDYEPIYRCPLPGPHPHKYTRHEAHKGQVISYESTNDVVRSMHEEIFFVSRRLDELIREELASDRLGGFSLAELRNYGNEGDSPRWLRPQAFLFERPLLADNEHDRCLECGRSPLFCRECGSPRCIDCGDHAVPAGLYAACSERRHRPEFYCRELMPARGVVLDARFWNGEDYCSYGTCGVITGRLAKFLAGHNARGAMIRPAQAYFPQGVEALRDLIANAQWTEGPQVVRSSPPQKRPWWWGWG